jgi:hypothetical protein
MEEIIRHPTLVQLRSLNFFILKTDDNSNQCQYFGDGCTFCIVSRHAYVCMYACLYEK